jgi:hypothetical protein
VIREEYNLWSEAVLVCEALKSKEQAEIEWACFIALQEPIVLCEPLYFIAAFAPIVCRADPAVSWYNYVVLPRDPRRG